MGKILGSFIKRQRIKNHYVPIDMAKALGVSKQYYYSIEAGTVNPKNPDKLEVLAKLFKTTTEHIGIMITLDKLIYYINKYDLPIKKKDIMEAMNDS